MYNTLDSPYNIPSPPPFIAGSYTEWDFELIDPKTDIILDVTAVPNIRFTMSSYGDYSNPTLDVSLRDNTPNKTYIKTYPMQKNRLTIFLYADDTKEFEDNYYDFQIEFIAIDHRDNSVVGQGKVKIFGRIQEV